MTDDCSTTIGGGGTPNKPAMFITGTSIGSAMGFRVDDRNFDVLSYNGGRIGFCPDNKHRTIFEAEVTSNGAKANYSLLFKIDSAQSGQLLTTTHDAYNKIVTVTNIDAPSIPINGTTNCIMYKSANGTANTISGLTYETFSGGVATGLNVTLGGIQSSYIKLPSTKLTANIASTPNATISINMTAPVSGQRLAIGYNDTTKTCEITNVHDTVPGALNTLVYKYAETASSTISNVTFDKQDTQTTHSYGLIMSHNPILAQSDLYMPHYGFKDTYSDIGSPSNILTRLGIDVLNKDQPGDRLVVLSPHDEAVTSMQGKPFIMTSANTSQYVTELRDTRDAGSQIAYSISQTVYGDIRIESHPDVNIEESLENYGISMQKRRDGTMRTLRWETDPETYVELSAVVNGTTGTKYKLQLEVAGADLGVGKVLAIKEVAGSVIKLYFKSDT